MVWPVAVDDDEFLGEWLGESVAFLSIPRLGCKNKR